MTESRRTDVERFRDVVANRLGLQFGDAKLAYLEEVLHRRARASGRRTSDYVEDLSNCNGSSEQVHALAQELTVGETYFFRNNDQFRAFVDVALRSQTSGSPRALRILSAGSSSGEEAYSLAMLVKESGVDQNCAIRGVDINPAALEKARRARYSQWALRETPTPARDRWFRADGREFVVDPSIVAMVAFDQRNLIVDDADLWRPSAYDVVFCRNVLMYFTTENAATVISRITESLVPGGYLFLGHAETLRSLSTDYHLCHTHNTFYYQRKELIESRRLRPSAPVESTASAGSWASTWLETVQQASERIRALSERRVDDRKASPRQATDAPFDLRVVLDLLRKERFADALSLLGTAPVAAARSSEVLLVRAVLLTHLGQLDEAERVCSELRQIDDLNAGMHYVHALCREGRGDRAGAIEHDQVACYLDSSFAMPRLHLGLMARRIGDGAVARRELTQAMALLEREDPSRLLLFSGGFSREALLSLCRAGIDALEGGR